MGVALIVTTASASPTYVVCAECDLNILVNAFDAKWCEQAGVSPDALVDLDLFLNLAAARCHKCRRNVLDRFRIK